MIEVLDMLLQEFSSDAVKADEKARLICYEVPALRCERLAWVDQNYLRDDTLPSVNAHLVAAQNCVALAHARGGGDVAPADGMCFVVPVCTVHAGPNPKYLGFGRVPATDIMKTLQVGDGQRDWPWRWPSSVAFRKRCTP